MTSVIEYIALFFLATSVFYYIRNDLARRKLRKANLTIIELQHELNSVKWSLDIKDTRGKASEEAYINPSAIRDRMHEQGWFDNRSTEK